MYVCIFAGIPSVGLVFVGEVC